MMIYLATQWAQKYDVDNDHGDDVVGEDDNNVVDIYIMMKCLSVCMSWKMITSSLEFPLTTFNHLLQVQVGFHGFSVSDWFSWCFLW